MPEPEHKTSSPLAARFSAAASTYHRHANIQRRVAEKLMTLLAKGGSGLLPHPTPSRILEIGCGTGILTEMLANTFPSAKVDAVDISAAMTARARDNLAEKRMINWIVADAGKFTENKKYPLIVSNCTLHWIMPIDLIVAKLSALLERDGQLAFAIMLRGTLGELNSARQRIAPHKPPRVALPGKDEVKKALAKAGLLLRTEKQETSRLEYPSAEKMLKQLHDQGLTGGNIPDSNPLLTRSEISRLIADYSKNYKRKNGVYATYRVLYCLAQKNAKGSLPKRWPGNVE